MATFSYIARNTEGERVTGTLAAATEAAVLAELQSRSLAPVTVHEVRRQATGRVSPRHMATAYRQLADLLRAGVPLLRALRLLARSKAMPKLAAVWGEIADQVADGSALADAMAGFPGVFPEIQVAMVRAGERGAFLGEVLERMGVFLEHQADMRAKILSNLLYPGVLLSVATGVIVFALVYLVPQFQDFYQRMELPWPTRILLGTSSLLTERWPFVLVFLIIVGAFVGWLRGQPRVRRSVLIAQTRVPKLGEVTSAMAVGRFARILGTLLENGIPMLPAMQVARDAVGHALLAEAIDEAIEAVRAGETLAGPLAASGLFTDEVVEMISVGESANNLPTVLTTVADTIEKRVDQLLTILLRLLEPMLLLGMGGVVFFIFMALIVPMLQMSSAL